MGGEGELPVTETITLTQEESKRMVLLESTYTVSSEELLRQAGFLVEQIEKRDTKGSSAKRVPVLADSLVAEPQGSKSSFGPNEGKVYIVSLGDGLGFGLFAGDKRGGGLIGYSEEGDFDPDAAPLEAQFLFQALTDYVSNTIEQTEAMRGDSIYQTLVARFGMGSKAGTKGDFIQLIEVDSSVRVDLGRTTEVTTTGVLMTTKWGQRWPYNMKIEQVHQQDYPAGCVATAVAQIMNYHKHGSYFVRYLWEQFPDRYWPASTNPATQSVAQLFYDLGLPANLNMDYATDGSGASSSNVPYVLNKYGFYHDGLYGINYNTLNTSLLNRRPVYISGKNRHGLWDMQYNEGEAHAWVIDGNEMWSEYDNFRLDYYYRGQFVESTQYKYLKTSGASRYHHNWGWEGGYDCWLIVGVFAPDPNDPDYNYEYDVAIITNIRPQ